MRQLLAASGLGLVATAAGVVGLAWLPHPPGRLGYDSIVANAAAPRLALLAAVGSGLGLPAVVSGTGRRLGLATLALGLVAGGAALALTLPPLAIARRRGLRVSPLRAVLGSERLRWRSARALGDGVAVSEVTVADEPGRRLMATLYRPPAGAGGRRGPAIVVVHGGAWQGGGRGENRGWSVQLAARGYTVLDADYRLAPDPGGWQAAVADVLDAHRWLAAQASALDLDPTRIALLGRSAGGHLALLAAFGALPPDAAASVPAASDVRPAAVVALYPPTDLSRLYVTANGDVRPGLLALLGGPPRVDPDAYERASPLAYVRPGLPPALLVHGTFDDAVPVGHSRSLARALRDHAGAAVDCLLLPGARHAFDLAPASVSSQLAFETLLAFLARALPS